MANRALVLTAPLLMTFAMPVQAAEYIITYEGTVSFGRDETGVFGEIGDLVGRAFIATYTLRFPGPYAQFNVASDESLLSGGNVYAPATPSPLSAKLTIGNYYYLIDGSRIGTVHYYNRPGFDQVNHAVDQRYNSENSYNWGYLQNNIGSINDFQLSSDFTRQLDYTATAGDAAGGQFWIEEIVDGNWVARARGELVPTRVTVRPALIPGAVPEPATWALLITGFAAVGGALRLSSRKRRELQVA